MIIFLIAAVWVACAMPAYGITLGYFHAEYPGNDRALRWFAGFYMLFGPASLAVAYFRSGRAKHGLMFRVPREDRR